MSDTFKTYNPVTLALGFFFVAGGAWTITMLILRGVVVVLFALIPGGLGIAIVHNQLRLRKNEK
jgi:hypothetical protein